MSSASRSIVFCECMNYATHWPPQLSRAPHTGSHGSIKLGSRYLRLQTCNLAGSSGDCQSPGDKKLHLTHLWSLLDLLCLNQYGRNPTSSH